MDRDPTSVIEIDLAAIARNLRTIRDALGADTRLGLVFPDHGTGLSTTRVAAALEQAGASLLAVHSPLETERLLQARLRMPILNTMSDLDIAPGGALYRGIVTERLHLAVRSLDQLERLIPLARRFGAIVHVHVVVDADGRLAGCPREDLDELMERIGRTEWVRLVAVTAGPRDDTGADEADDRTATETAIIGLAESDRIPAGCLVPARSGVSESSRPGLAFVGAGCWAGYPAPYTHASLGARTLEPSVRWVSRVIQVKRVETGASVGYGARWTAARPSVVGLVPVGYATGYPTGVGAVDGRSGCAEVRVLTADGPFEAPVVGTVSMDQMAIDMTADRRATGVDIGTEVELIGNDPRGSSFLTRLADQAGRTPAELLAAIHPDVPRRYGALCGRAERDLPARDADAADGARLRAATATMGRR